jgi:hypothetical protein
MYIPVLIKPQAALPASAFDSRTLDDSVSCLSQ